MTKKKLIFSDGLTKLLTALNNLYTAAFAAVLFYLYLAVEMASIKSFPSRFVMTTY
jgi:hypothetical protein